MNGKKSETNVYKLHAPKDGFLLLWWENMAVDNMELDKAMQFSIAEVCNKSGGEYHLNTLDAIIVICVHFLRARWRFVDFLDDIDFVKMR
jgi:hypothetical protein